MPSACLLLGRLLQGRGSSVPAGFDAMERGLKNVLVVSLGFLLLFTAYGGLQNLQVSALSGSAAHTYASRRA